MGKICDVKQIRPSETGRAIWRPLASVKETSLLGSHRAFKHAPLLRVPLCVSWAFLVFLYFADRCEALEAGCALYIIQVPKFGALPQKTTGGQNMQIWQSLYSLDQGENELIWEARGCNL